MATIGLDVSPFKRGALELQADARKMGEEIAHHAEGHGTFLHAESSSKAFHHVLKDITEQSPIMGTALRLALNPITGIIMGSVLAWKYVTDQIKEANKEMDDWEESSQRAWTNENAAVRKSVEERRKITEEFEEWKRKRAQIAAQKEEEVALEKEITLLKQKFALTKEIIEQTKGGGPKALEEKQHELEAGFLEAKAKLMERESGKQRLTSEAYLKLAGSTEEKLNDPERVLKQQRAEQELKISEKRIEELEKMLKAYAKGDTKEGGDLGRVLGVPGAAEAQGELVLEKEHAFRIEERINENRKQEMELRRKLKDFQDGAAHSEARAAELEKDRLRTSQDAAEKRIQSEADLAKKRESNHLDELTALEKVVELDRRRAQIQEELKNPKLGADKKIELESELEDIRHERISVEKQAKRQAAKEFSESMKNIDNPNVRVGAYGGGDPTLNVAANTNKSAVHLEHILKVLQSHTRLLRSVRH